MTTVAIIYFSGTGNTRRAAEAVMAGAESAGVSVHLLEVVGEEVIAGRWDNAAIAATLDESDAIIFGTPTYMGSVAAQFKAFMDAMAPRWYTAAWRDKLAAGFTVSALVSGDKLNALTDLVTFAMQMGMIWVGSGGNFAKDGVNPNGFYLGAGLQAAAAGLDETDLTAANQLGHRVATLAFRQ